MSLKWTLAFLSPKLVHNQNMNSLWQIYSIKRLFLWSFIITWYIGADRMLAGRNEANTLMSSTWFWGQYYMFINRIQTNKILEYCLITALVAWLKQHAMGILRIENGFVYIGKCCPWWHSSSLDLLWKLYIIHYHKHSIEVLTEATGGSLHVFYCNGNPLSP